MSSTPILPFQQNKKSASHRILRHDIFHSSLSSKEEMRRSPHQTVDDGFDRPKRPLKNCLRENSHMISLKLPPKSAVPPDECIAHQP